MKCGAKKEPSPKSINKRVARILLECVLVTDLVVDFFFRFEFK